MAAWENGKNGEERGRLLELQKARTEHREFEKHGPVR